MRSCCFSSLLLFALVLVLAPRVAAEQVRTHDPVMAREGDTYYLFSTGPGISVLSSKDRVHWTRRPPVFTSPPVWAKDVAPSFDGRIWAPDIVYHNGRYFLYYSVSAFGRNTSAIGVTVNTTLDATAPGYRWDDHGIVLRSIPNRDLWNAIDPAIIFGDDGTPWMSFGSFWGGLKLVKLDATLTRPAEPQEWHSLAKRERSLLVDDTLAEPGQIEAPFIFKKGEYHYLFVSWDKCCAGVESTYKIMVGRARDVRGPYVDREGKKLTEGGGTLVLAGDSAWPGVGHNSLYTFDGKDHLVFHAYETADRGRSKLKIAEVSWDADLWPVIDPAVLNSYQSTLVAPAP